MAIDKSNANEESQSTSVGGALRRNWVPLPLLSNCSEFVHTKWTEWPFLDILFGQNVQNGHFKA